MRKTVDEYSHLPLQGHIKYWLDVFQLLNDYLAVSEAQSTGEAGEAGKIYRQSPIVLISC